MGHITQGSSPSRRSVQKFRWANLGDIIEILSTFFDILNSNFVQPPHTTQQSHLYTLCSVPFYRSSSQFSLGRGASTVFRCNTYNNNTSDRHLDTRFENSPTRCLLPLARMPRMATTDILMSLTSLESLPTTIHMISLLQYKVC